MAHASRSHHYSNPIEFHTWTSAIDLDHAKKKDPLILRFTGVLADNPSRVEKQRTPLLVLVANGGNSFTLQRERVTCRSRASRAFRIFEERASVVSPFAPFALLPRTRARGSSTSLYLLVLTTRSTYLHTRDTHLPPSLELVSAERPRLAGNSTQPGSRHRVDWLPASSQRTVAHRGHARSGAWP